MQKYDIGVIPELLANYHWRVEGQQGGVYGNTVVAGHSQHLALDVVIRNRMLRRDLEAGRFGPGCMMSLLRWQRRMLDRQGATVKLEAMVTQEAAATRKALARCKALAQASGDVLSSRLGETNAGPFSALGSAAPASLPMAKGSCPGATVDPQENPPAATVRGRLAAVQRPGGKPRLTLTTRVHWRYDCPTMIPPSRKNLR